MLPLDNPSRDTSLDKPVPEEGGCTIPPLVRLPSRANSTLQGSAAALPARKPGSTNQPADQPCLCSSLQEPGSTSALEEKQFSLFLPAITRQLPAKPTAAVTRVLSGVLPGSPETSTRRLPVVIKSEMKKMVLAPSLPYKKRRLLLNVSGLLMLCVILGMTFLTVSPLGHDLGWDFNPLQFSGNMIKNLNHGPDSLILQATATAIYHHQNDGYDPYYSGGQILTNGNVSLNWPAGECTFWANYEYHSLTGQWVSWSGNAAQWVTGAQRAGWIVSRSPHVPSIIVLMPGVHGASSYGHVAVVMKIIDNATVQTSNMNWYANGGGFNRVSYMNFTVGPGVYFIWHS